MTSPSEATVRRVEHIHPCCEGYGYRSVRSRELLQIIFGGDMEAGGDRVHKQTELLSAHVPLSVHVGGVSLSPPPGAKVSPRPER